MKEERIFIPKRLIEARLAKGLSRSNLAEDCGLSSQAICSYESATRIPSPSTLGTIAEKLGLPLRYFISSRPSDSGGLGTTFFRSLSSARTRREHDRRAQCAVWAAELNSWVDRFVKLPALELPDMHDISCPEEAARKVREAWNLGDGPISNLVKLFESKGLTVVRQNLEGNKVDAFSRTALGKALIFLSSNKASSVRSRFDAAHELGHLTMHYHLTDAELQKGTTLKKIEFEANQFASAFLMPAESFARDLYGCTLQSFINLKRRWKVSIQAMIMRATDLNILDEEQKSRLMTQVSARGMRVNEPLDDELPVEEPTVLRKAWELITDNKIRPANAICEDLCLPHTVVASVLNVPAERLASENAVSNIIPFTLRLVDKPAFGRDGDLPFAG